MRDASRVESDVMRDHRQPTSIKHRPVEGGTAGATHEEKTTRTDVRFSPVGSRTRRELETTAFEPTTAFAAMQSQCPSCLRQEQLFDPAGRQDQPKQPEDSEIRHVNE